MTRDDTFRDWDAAYVLGALTPEDRRAYETYLAQNPDRAADVSEIAGIPGLLNRLSVTEAVALTVEKPAPAEDLMRPGDVATLIRSLNHRRSRVRLGFAASLVAVAASALLLGLSLANLNISPPSATESSSTSTPSTLMLTARPGTLEAELAATAKPWGTRLDVRCTYSARWVSRSETFELVVTSVQGTRTVVASWSARGSGAKDVAAATQIPLDQIRRIEIADGDTHTLLATTQL